LGKIRRIVGQSFSLRVQSTASDDPAHMRPPCTFLWSVRISQSIAMLMMDAMRRHPCDRATLQGQRAADRQEVFDGFRHLVPAVHQKAMIAHADAAVDGENIENRCDSQVCPTEEEERSDGANVEDGHEDGRNPYNT